MTDERHPLPSSYPSLLPLLLPPSSPSSFLSFLSFWSLSFPHLLLSTNTTHTLTHEYTHVHRRPPMDTTTCARMRCVASFWNPQKGKLAVAKTPGSDRGGIDLNSSDLNLGLFSYPVLQAADILLYKLRVFFFCSLPTKGSFHHLSPSPSPLPLPLS